MADVVNLRMVRKRTSRRHDEVRAAENRTVHGRSKADRQGEASERDKAASYLDQHRIETETIDEVTSHQTLDRDRRT